MIIARFERVNRGVIQDIISMGDLALDVIQTLVQAGHQAFTVVVQIVTSILDIFIVSYVWPVRLIFSVIRLRSPDHVSLSSDSVDESACCCTFFK